MFCCICPTLENLNESLTTLKFAKLTKRLSNYII